MKEKTSLSDYEQSNDEDLVSSAPFVQPLLKLKVPLLKNIEWITILVGCIDFGGKVHLVLGQKRNQLLKVL
jgi:hypothetical protein